MLEVANQLFSKWMQVQAQYPEIADGREVALEPELAICDAHHHLWRRPPVDYLLNDFLRDLQSGHRIVSTVAVECRYAYRNEGPDELRPGGASEFPEGVGNRVTAETPIKTRIAAAIIGYADLSLGDAVATVLEAHLAASPARFRGIRHSATWDESTDLRSEAPHGLLADRRFRQGFHWLKKLGLSFDCWAYHPQLDEVADL